MSRALKCVFIGYFIHKKGYRCYHPPTKYIFIAIDVVFYEDTIYFSKFDFHGEYLEEIQTLIYNLEEDVVEVSDQNIR